MVSESCYVPLWKICEQPRYSGFEIGQLKPALDRELLMFKHGLAGRLKGVRAA
jgi:hypothetical protein